MRLTQCKAALPTRRSTVIGVLIGLWHWRSRERLSIPVRNKRLVSFPKRPKQFGLHPVLWSISTKRADFQSSGMLRSADLYLFTDISVQPTSPIFNGQTVQKFLFSFWTAWPLKMGCYATYNGSYDVSVKLIGLIFEAQTFSLNCLTSEDGADNLSRNVWKYQSTLR